MQWNLTRLFLFFILYKDLCLLLRAIEIENFNTFKKISKIPHPSLNEFLFTKLHKELFV